MMKKKRFKTLKKERDKKKGIFEEEREGKGKAQKKSRMEGDRPVPTASHYTYKCLFSTFWVCLRNGAPLPWEWDYGMERKCQKRRVKQQQ